MNEVIPQDLFGPHPLTAVGRNCASETRGHSSLKSIDLACIRGVDCKSLAMNNYTVTGYICQRLTGAFEGGKKCIRIRLYKPHQYLPLA